jgi:A/G-specific adenine glycosylase
MSTTRISPSAGSISKHGHALPGTIVLRRFRHSILAWYRRHPRVFPWRETHDPYSVLVGELLLQRTRGEQAVEVFSQFIRRWPAPADLARARRGSIEAVIRPIGLAKRATILKRLGRALAALGAVPTDPKTLDELPGVGPYAAHSVPVFALGRNLPLVDWVIARVLRRYFGLPEGERPNADGQLWDLAGRLAELTQARELWLGTLDFAAAVCKPRPLCGECPLSAGCEFFDAELGSRRRRPSQKPVYDGRLRLNAAPRGRRGPY